MENKKLLKFLYKDIAEIEELFVEKGSEGFDEFEIEFIQSRFIGAKQVIQILSEKENKQLKKIRPRPAANEPEEEEVAEEEVLLSVDEEESVQSQSQSPLSVNEEEESDSSQLPVEEEEESVQSQLPVEEEEESVSSESVEEEVDADQVVSNIPEPETNVELDVEGEQDDANHRLGDSFSKEKSVNELLGVDGSNKLEYKISNSPVASIKAAIGINDRYQYIRELFEGNGDVYSKAVSDLDHLNTIQEAVAYLQQNYKWKKNDTSLKFVNLVKRRFPNG